MFIVWNDDVFNGYGVIAIGHTEAQAVQNLYKEYRKTSAGWNEDGVYCKSRKSFVDNWGFNSVYLDPDDSENCAKAMNG